MTAAGFSSSDQTIRLVDRAAMVAQPENDREETRRQAADGKLAEPDGNKPLVAQWREGISEQAIAAAKRLNESTQRDQKKIISLGRAASSVIKVYQHFIGRPIATAVWLSENIGMVPVTVNKAPRHLTSLGILREATGKKRNGIFAYPAYIGIINEGRHCRRTDDFGPAPDFGRGAFPVSGQSWPSEKRRNSRPHKRASSVRSTPTRKAAEDDQKGDCGDLDKRGGSREKTF